MGIDGNGDRKRGLGYCFGGGGTGVERVSQSRDRVTLRKGLRGARERADEQEGLQEGLCQKKLRKWCQEDGPPLRKPCGRQTSSSAQTLAPPGALIPGGRNPSPDTLLQAEGPGLLVEK